MMTLAAVARVAWALLLFDLKTHTIPTIHTHSTPTHVSETRLSTSQGVSGPDKCIPILCRGHPLLFKTRSMHGPCQVTQTPQNPTGIHTQDPSIDHDGH